MMLALRKICTELDMVEYNWIYCPDLVVETLASENYEKDPFIDMCKSIIDLDQDVPHGQPFTESPFAKRDRQTSVMKVLSSFYEMVVGYDWQLQVESVLF